MQNAECIMQIVFVGVGAHDNPNFAGFVYNGRSKPLPYNTNVYVSVRHSSENVTP